MFEYSLEADLFQARFKPAVVNIWINITSKTWALTQLERIKISEKVTLSVALMFALRKPLLFAWSSPISFRLRGFGWSLILPPFLGRVRGSKMRDPENEVGSSRYQNRIHLRVLATEGFANIFLSISRQYSPTTLVKILS